LSPVSDFFFTRHRGMGVLQQDDVDLFGVYGAGLPSIVRKPTRHGGLSWSGSWTMTTCSPTCSVCDNDNIGTSLWCIWQSHQADRGEAQGAGSPRRTEGPNHAARGEKCHQGLQLLISRTVAVLEAWGTSTRATCLFDAIAEGATSPACGC
jgi:hypothetical protein